jgi:hypothetical protein
MADVFASISLFPIESSEAGCSWFSKPGTHEIKQQRIESLVHCSRDVYSIPISVCCAPLQRIDQAMRVPTACELRL